MYPVRHFSNKPFMYRPFEWNLVRDFMDSFNNIHEHTTTPQMNVKESDAAYTVEMAAPGMNKQDFTISMNEDGNLTIKMEKKSDTQQNSEETERYLRREFSYTQFEQTLILPDNIEREHISAVMTDGVLTITMPKHKEEKQKLAREIVIG